MAGAPETVDPTLYGAGAGVTLFLTDLASETGDGELAKASRDGAGSLAATPDEGRFGLYTGLAGMVFAVDHAAAVLDDRDLRCQAARMLDQLIDAGQPAGAGIEWPAWANGRGPWQELFHGSAGIALVAAGLGRLDAATGAGRPTLDSGPLGAAGPGPGARRHHELVGGAAIARAWSITVQ